MAEIKKTEERLEKQRRDRELANSKVGSWGVETVASPTKNQTTSKRRKEDGSSNSLKEARIEQALEVVSQTEYLLKRLINDDMSIGSFKYQVQEIKTTSDIAENLLRPSRFKVLMRENMSLLLDAEAGVSQMDLVKITADDWIRGIPYKSMDKLSDKYFVEPIKLYNGIHFIKQIDFLTAIVKRVIKNFAEMKKIVAEKPDEIVIN